MFIVTTTIQNHSSHLRFWLRDIFRNKKKPCNTGQKKLLISAVKNLHIMRFQLQIKEINLFNFFIQHEKDTRHFLKNCVFRSQLAVFKIICQSQIFADNRCSRLVLSSGCHLQQVCIFEIENTIRHHCSIANLKEKILKKSRKKNEKKNHTQCTTGKSAEGQQSNHKREFKERI